MMKDVLVCDIGAYSLKLGFAGEKAPSLVVPCMYGTSHNGSTKEDGLKDEVSFGTDAWELCKDGEPKLLFNDSGGVKDWEKLEALIVWSLNKLVGDENDGFSKTKLFLSKPANFTNNDVVKLSELLFVKMKFRAVTMFPEAGLALVGQDQDQGQLSGLVVEAGEGSIRLSAVFQGHLIVGASRKFPVGGRVLTRNLVKLLAQQGYQLNPKRDFDSIIVDPTKQSFCFVAPSYTFENERAFKETTLLLEETLLLDGAVIDIEKERFETVEPLFDPSLLSFESKGLGHIIVELVNASVDCDCVSDCIANIVLSGGCSLIPGFLDRLQDEVRAQFREKNQWSEDRLNEIKVKPANNAQYSVFCGASAFADACSEERKFWVTQKDFARDGVKFLVKDCKFT